MPWSPRKLIISLQPLFNRLSAVHELFLGSQAACGILRSLIFAGQASADELAHPCSARSESAGVAPRFMRRHSSDQERLFFRARQHCACPPKPMSGLRRLPAAPSHLTPIPARSWDATARQNCRHPRIPLRNLRRPGGIAPHPVRNLTVPGRNARVPGRNLHLPARRRVLPSRNTPVPGRNLPPRPRNHRVPTRLEHVRSSIHILNCIEIKWLQETHGFPVVFGGIDPSRPG